MYPDLSKTSPRIRPLPALRASALLLLDCQYAFLDPSKRTGAINAYATLQQCVRLANCFQLAQRPLVLTRHVHDSPPRQGGMGSFWKNFLLRAHDASSLHPDVLSLSPSLILEKQQYSAFYSTNFEHWLRTRHIDTVVIAGFLTHACVDCTARDAFQRGFDVVIAQDACASIHSELHESALLCLSHVAAHLAPTSLLQEICRELPHA